MLSGDRASILGRPFAVALGYLGLGERDSFFAWLERAAENRSRDLVLLEVLPVMDAVRHDPRFAAFTDRHLLVLLKSSPRSWAYVSVRRTRVAGVRMSSLGSQRQQS